MATVEQAVATFERNIEAQTGRAVQDWAGLVQSEGLARHGQAVAWLKATHGLSHSHANHIAKHAFAAAAPPTEDDPFAQLLVEGREGLRPICEALAGAVRALGPDVELAPKKANVSIRRRRQFALIQPTTRTRVDLGLILDRRPEGRLEASGSFNAMFSHRVKLATPQEVDAELLAWLQEAYAAAG